MQVFDQLPSHDSLLTELQMLRRVRWRALRELDLPTLHRAAVSAGLTRTDTQPQPQAIEALIRQAIGRFGGGSYQEAALRTFGLTDGLKVAFAPERRVAAAAACHASVDTFRRRYENEILGVIAEEIAELARDGVGSGSPPPAVAHHDDHRTTNVIRSTTSPPQPPRRRRRQVATVLAVTVLAVLAVLGVVALNRPPTERTWNGITAAELEQRYDGKLPQGQDGSGSDCADGNEPPSLAVEHATTPPVMGPDGARVGSVQLRRSQACATVVWARVLWDDNDKATYQIPPGWTLHIVMKRADTDAAIDEPERSTGSRIPYEFSRMLSSARECVFAEVYFASANSRTATSQTSCVQV